MSTSFFTKSVNPSASLRVDSIMERVSSERNGYLAVFSSDNREEVALLYPAGGLSSAPILSGYKSPLVDGAVVGEGQGCEWLVAVFSDTPLKVKDMTRAIKTAQRAMKDDTCELKVVVKNARNVRILPVKR